MQLHRRAGAPRLIDWTGERCVPWAPDVQVVYEHYHRYLWAADLVRGARVLELASGEGFGAAILADTAASVVGLDLDRRTVAHSSLNYRGSELEFRQGDAHDLSAFDDGAFDAVVAFEMIEHVADPERVLAEIDRVLASDGLVIISTPERRVYSEKTGERNPFHTREFTEAEFRELLQEHFPNVRVWGQRAITGSAIACLDSGTASLPDPTFFLQRAGDGWESLSGIAPRYTVALASRRELPAVAAHSWLADPGLALMREAEVRVQMAGASALEAARAELSEVRAELASARAVVAQRDAELDQRQTELEFELRQHSLTRHAAEANAQQVEQLQEELESARRFTTRVNGSVTWQLFQAVRARVFRLLGGERSLVTLSLQLALRGVGRTLSRSRVLPATTAPAVLAEAPIELPRFTDPQVSIIVPLHSRADLTRTCLESIAAHTHGVSYEVILVDDTADEDTKALLGAVHGGVTLVNECNLGYLRSVNRAAGHARGDWLVLANNDIEVRSGWLTALLQCGTSSPDVAVVTPQYLYPDGVLNEAGGIIWRDGTGMNFGRGADPTGWRYQYRREVDYGSAAALLVRMSFWREVGGYDERFAPMYYEDADLCLGAWERGQRVIYEPRAEVVHVEGGTAGTDLNSGHKRHQEVNRLKFVTKWGERLRQDHLRDSVRNIRAASDRRRGPRVMLIDFRVPTWDRDAGGVRTRGMIKALQALDHRVTLVPDNLFATEPYAGELQDEGVELWHGAVDARAELAQIAPELVTVISCRPTPTSRWIELIREYAPGVPLVYDTVDLHWLREARRDAWAHGIPEIRIGPRAKALRELELALIRASDATLVVSEDERAQVLADVPDASVHVVPMVHEPKVDVTPAAQRKGVLFLGGFEHSPNVDAAIRLVRGVMPLVWQERPDVPVTIVGSVPPTEVQQLAGPLVDVTGWVSELEPLLGDARLMVAPLNYGAGLKGKLTQALASGLPVVTTPTGAEGLQATDGEDILIGSSDEDLAARVVRLATDDELWQRLSSAGLKLAAERWSPQVMCHQLESLIESLAPQPTRDAAHTTSLSEA